MTTKFYSGGIPADRVAVMNGDGTENDPSLIAPAQHVVLITPADGSDLATPIRGISFSSAGALKVTTVGGETVTIPSGALQAGVIHPLRITKVFSTGTTASNIVGYY